MHAFAPLGSTPLQALPAAGTTTTLDAATGAFTVTGNAAVLAPTLLANTGAYTLTGIAASFSVVLVETVTPYTVAGQDAPGTPVLVTDTGAYVVSGQAAPLAPTLLANTGSYLVTGVPTELKVIITGGGKKHYPEFLSFLPSPPLGVKPNKPFRPVWDQRRKDELERAKRLEELPPGPVPLPPAALFERQTDAELGLPDIDFTPPDPAAIGRGAQDARDLADLAAALEAMGRAPPAPVQAAAPAPQPLSSAPEPIRRPRIVVPPTDDVGQRMRDARDISDAMALLKAIGLI